MQTNLNAVVGVATIRVRPTKDIVKGVVIVDEAIKIGDQTPTLMNFGVGCTMRLLEAAAGSSRLNQ